MAIRRETAQPPTIWVATVEKQGAQFDLRISSVVRIQPKPFVSGAMIYAEDLERAVFKKIYVRLLWEGVLCWRPVVAEKLDTGDYLISKSQSIPDDEHWEYGPGEAVVVVRMVCRDGKVVPIAIGKNEYRETPSSEWKT